MRESYIESLIPEILRKNNYQMELLMDYCQSFDLQPEKASLCYLECIFLDSAVSFQTSSSSSSHSHTVASHNAPNSSVRENNHTRCAGSLTSSSSLNSGSSSAGSSYGSFSHNNYWSHKLRSITNGIHENILRKYLLKILIKMNPFDYEKIMFLCYWLMELTPSHSEEEEEEEEGKNGIADCRDLRNNVIYEDEEYEEKSLLLLDNSTLLSSHTSSSIGSSTSQSTTSSPTIRPLSFFLNNYQLLADLINLLN
jgi:hypothetical protein